MAIISSLPNKARNKLISKQSGVLCAVLIVVVYLVALNDGSENWAVPSSLLLKAAAPPRHVVCKTSKGRFDIDLFPEQCPNGYEQLIKMVNHKFFDQGIAFFRINDVCIQFGADQERRPKEDPFLEVRKSWPKDSNIYNNSTKDRKEHPWTRGTFAMIGGTQMLITRKTGGHPMGTLGHDCVLGRISENDMVQVLDKLYNGYGNALDNKGKGLKQVEIFKRGMEYIKEEYPLTDYIFECKVG